MRIDWLHFKSFLKHEDLRLEFAPDLNTMRAPNEGGKSSCVEGFGYFLSGAAALEKTLEDTVNDQAESKSGMKVSCGFTHRGQSYSGYRGVSGAELKDSAGKVLVTGQKPLTEYLEKLLDLPAGRAHHVMLARQNEIRGVLALGPTAATEFIEKLADFSEIDKLIKRMVSELPNGKTDAIEAQIQAAEQTLATLTIPVVPNHDERIAAHRAKAEAAQERKKEIEAELAKGRAEVGGALAARAQLLLQIETAKPALSELQAEVSSLREIAAQRKSFEAKSAELQGVLETAIRYDLYSEVQALKKEVGDSPVWEGDEASLNAEIALQTKELQGLREQSLHLSLDIKNLKGKKIGSTVCPTCGHDSGDPVAAAAHNAKLDVEIEVETKKHNEILAQITEKEAEVKELQEVVETGIKVDNKAKLWPDALVSVITGTVPKEFSFIGEEPDVPMMSIEEVKAQLLVLAEKSGLAENKEALAAAEARFQEASNGLARLEADYAKIVVPEFNSAPLEKEQKELDAAYLVEFNAVTAIQNEIAVLEEARKNALADRARWQALLDKNTSDLKETQENNILIKAVRTARLQISDRIWSTILSGISSYFSQLRGVASIVTRTPEGFLVDGKPGRLSGSTLDILGLALRIVVAKVFADSGLLVVDEPSAGCDVNRTANMAAVLKTAGFEQVWWVSHDAISEACAANLIEL